MPDVDIMENRTLDELSVGDAAHLTRTLTHDDIALFAAMSGDVNPAHLDKEFGEASPFHGIIGHGMWGGSLISTVLGTQLPGPGTIYLSQSLKFLRPVHPGDTVTVTVEVQDISPKGRITLACRVEIDEDTPVITGEAVVLAPREKVRYAGQRPRAVLYERGERLKTLIDSAKEGAAPRTGVVHPVDERSLKGALEAADAGLMTPVLIGPKAKIKAAAKAADLSLADAEVIDAPHSHAAAEHAVALAQKGELAALMKGALHTDELMGAVVSRASGLRTERRVSHVYVIDTPAYEKMLFISDAAINIAPTLEDKRDIVQNAIDVAQALGVETPKVAILSAVETVYPKMTSTLDAAALCKMADRGQITGGELDGPLAFDNAISVDAAAAKGITSRVAGQADILIAPDLEAGNMMAKQLDYLAGAVAAGVVMGARVPIILTSRAEGPLARTAASAVSKLVCLRRDKKH